MGATSDTGVVMADEGLVAGVQWLRISEIGEMWSPQLGIPRGVIERELRFGLFKIEQGAADMRERLNAPPDEASLPSVETLVARDFIERFCTESEEWQLPEFWFEMKRRDSQGPSYPGRPSVMRAIVQELEARAERDELEDTLAEQARQLSSWAEAEFPGKQTPKPGATENGIRLAYRLAKRGERRPH